MTIKIFLGNLNSDTTSDKLRPLFEKYGEVAECDVLKNFGFVHMQNKNDANKAIAQLDGYSVDGNNIRVELSTGKRKEGGGGGKFEKKGFYGGGGGGRPYGPPGGRGGGRGRGDFGGRGDRFGPYPPPPPPMIDRYDPYYRYYMEREAFYSRMGGDRLPGGGGREPYPRERLDDRFPDPRDRIPPPRPFMEERARGFADPYARGREALDARPPPEYYDRKPSILGGAGRGADTVGAAGAAAGGQRAGGFSNGVNGGGGGGDYYGRGPMDRPGGASLGGAAGGGAGAGGDFYRQGAGAGGQQGGYGRAMGGPGQGGYNNF